LDFPSIVHRQNTCGCHCDRNTAHVGMYRAAGGFDGLVFPPSIAIGQDLHYFLQGSGHISIRKCTDEP
jgi:hypothetical protein